MDRGLCRGRGCRAGGRKPHHEGHVVEQLECGKHRGFDEESRRAEFRVSAARRTMCAGPSARRISAGIWRRSAAYQGEHFPILAGRAPLRRRLCVFRKVVVNVNHHLTRSGAFSTGEIGNSHPGLRVCALYGSPSEHEFLISRASKAPGREKYIPNCIPNCIPKGSKGGTWVYTGLGPQGQNGNCGSPKVPQGAAVL